jgi:hypothetical protein
MEAMIFLIFQHKIQKVLIKDWKNIIIWIN